MKPDAQMVAEFFPKFGAPDYSTEVSRLLALRPDVVITTSWGGDLDTLVRQSGQRGLLQQSTFVLAIGESSIQRLGKDLPEGVIVGARGDHYFLHPEFKNEPAFKAFAQAFKDKTGAWPIYPVYHMARRSRRCRPPTTRRSRPTTATGRRGSRSSMRWRARSSQPASAGRSRYGRKTTRGSEAQLVGVTKSVPGLRLQMLDNMMVFDPKVITNPAGMKSVDWVKSLKPDFIKMEVPTFKQ